MENMHDKPLTRQEIEYERSLHPTADRTDPWLMRRIYDVMDRRYVKGLEEGNSRCEAEHAAGRYIALLFGGFIGFLVSVVVVVVVTCALNIYSALSAFGAFTAVGTALIYLGFMSVVVLRGTPIAKRLVCKVRALWRQVRKQEAS